MFPRSNTVRNSARDAGAVSDAVIQPSLWAMLIEPPPGWPCMRCQELRSLRWHRRFAAKGFPTVWTFMGRSCATGYYRSNRRVTATGFPAVGTIICGSWGASETSCKISVFTPKYCWRFCESSRVRSCKISVFRPSYCWRRTLWKLGS